MYTDNSKQRRKTFMCLAAVCICISALYTMWLCEIKKWVCPRKEITHVISGVFKSKWGGSWLTFFVMPFALAATFVISSFYIVFYIYIWFWALFCEQDVVLDATAQKATFLFLFSSHPVDRFWCRLNQKVILFEEEYNKHVIRIKVVTKNVEVTKQ